MVSESMSMKDQLLTFVQSDGEFVKHKLWEVVEYYYVSNRFDSDPERVAERQEKLNRLRAEFGEQIVDGLTLMAKQQFDIFERPSGVIIKTADFQTVNYNIDVYYWWKGEVAIFL